MLREAVRVGLVLNPCGVALQTALRLPHSLVLTSSLGATTSSGIPTSTSSATAATTDTLDPRLHALDALAKILESHSHDAKKEVDGWSECKPFIAQLSQSVLAEIVEAAANIDEFPEGFGGAVSPEAIGAGAPGPNKTTELSMDMKREYKESLTLAWKPVEMLLLATRHYTPEGAKERNVVR